MKYLIFAFFSFLLLQCKNETPVKELIIGKWSAVVDGDTIVWFVQPFGKEKFYWYHENYVQFNEGSWELKGNTFYEKTSNIPDFPNAVSQINFLTNDHMVLTVIENGYEKQHQQERHYFRQNTNPKIAWLQGTWLGKVKDSYKTDAPNIDFKDSYEYSVELNYDETTGTCNLSYPTSRCRGRWLLTRQEKNVLFFAERIENQKDAHCLDYMNYKLTRKSNNDIEIYGFGAYPLDEKFGFEAIIKGTLNKK